MSRGRWVVRSEWDTLLLNRFQRPLNVWSDHPAIDLPIAGAVVGAHAWIVYGEHVGNVIHWTNQGQRLALYAAGGTVMALIAGFAGTAIAQYGSSSGPVVTALRSAHGKAIRRNWLNITKWLLVSTILCLAAMAIDGEKSPRGSEWVFETALALSIAKFVRLLFLFGLIMSSVDSEVNTPKNGQKAATAAPSRRGTSRSQRSQ